MAFESIPQDDADPQPIALVVDDEPLVLRLLSTILAAKGWQVIQASSGREGLELTEGIALSLLITDLEMPGMDGLELAHELGLRNPNTPILMVSERPEPSLPTRRAPDVFLAKPFRIHELLGHVADLTGFVAPPTLGIVQ